MRHRRTKNEVRTPDWLVRHMVDYLEPIEPEGKYLEITCWHAPFACEILDRKLAQIDQSDFEAVKKVYQTIYGYELMPDNLAEGRRNIFSRFEDPDPVHQQEIKKIILLNFPLMDGLTGLDPVTGQPVSFMDWDTGEYISFRDMTEDEFRRERK